MVDTKRPLLLTTTDNPYSPFDSFTQWYLEDMRLGHNTCGLIHRLVGAVGVLNDGGEQEAMRTIISINASGKHVAVGPMDYGPLLLPHVKVLADVS